MHGRKWPTLFPLARTRRCHLPPSAQLVATRKLSNRTTLLKTQRSTVESDGEIITAPRIALVLHHSHNVSHGIAFLPSPSFQRPDYDRRAAPCRSEIVLLQTALAITKSSLIHRRFAVFSNCNVSPDGCISYWSHSTLLPTLSYPLYVAIRMCPLVCVSLRITSGSSPLPPEHHHCLRIITTSSGPTSRSLLPLLIKLRSSPILFGSIPDQHRVDTI